MKRFCGQCGMRLPYHNVDCPTSVVRPIEIYTLRVELQAKARFYFRVDRELVSLLMEAAKSHYDGQCQRACSRAGAQIMPGYDRKFDKNGVLTMWHDSFERDAKPYEEVTIGASWDDLDLVAKICEPYHTQVNPRCTRFHVQIMRMFERAGPKIMKEWKYAFEV